MIGNGQVIDAGAAGLGEGADVAIIGLIRDGKRRYGAARNAVLQAGDVTRPQRAVLVGPALVDQLDRHRVEVQTTLTARLLRQHETRAFQHRQVLHDGDSAHVEVFCQRAHVAAGIPVEDVQDAPAVRVGQRLEYRVEAVVRRHK